MPPIKELQKLQHTQIQNICNDFIKHGSGFYHPQTKKLSFILDGCCIKSECCYRDQDKEGRGFGVRKILLPLQIRKNFKTTLDEECVLPLNKIGTVVVCLSHFFIEHQKLYLRDGAMPLEARLMGKKDKTHVEGKPIPEPPTLMLRDAAKGSKAWRGYKMYAMALSNTDWVNLI